MGYRDPAGRTEITEAEAHAAATARVGYRLDREATEYAWGWVYDPAPPLAFGPGPVSVTRRGNVIAHGSSMPVDFSDEKQPVDRFAQRSAPWWRRLLGMRRG